MTTYTFPAGQIIKKDNFLYKILGEAGEMRFVSRSWKKEEADEKDNNGLKRLEQCNVSLFTIHELNAYGYVPISPEESGLSEEWCPKDEAEIWSVEEAPHKTYFNENSSWNRALLKTGLIKRTKEEAEEAYRRLMQE